MRVSVAQFGSGTDAAENRAVCGELVARAAADGAELVVLPEAAMYPFDRPAPELAAAAEALDGPFVETLVAAAARYDLVAVAGMFETGPEPPGIYNTVVAVDRAGVLCRYRKLHMYDALGKRESDSFLPGPIDGTELGTLERGGLVLGILTCYDLRFPEPFRALADRGATAFVLPAAWVAGPLKTEQWLTLCRARAIENTAYLLAAAQPPPDYCGHSVVLDPMGVALAELEDGQAVASAEISPTRVREVRALLPVLEQRRYRVHPRDSGGAAAEVP